MRYVVIEKNELACGHLHELALGGIPHTGICLKAKATKTLYAVLRHQLLVLARQHLQATIAARGVLQRDPCRDGVARCQWPVGRVLMPGNCQCTRHLAEKLAPPQDQVGTEQSSHTLDDRLLSTQMIDAGTVQVAKPIRFMVQSRFAGLCL